MERLKGTGLPWWHEQNKRVAWCFILERRAVCLIYARRRQRASHGPKRSDASVPHVFPKPVSKVGDTLHAMVGSRLDAFSNRPTTSTRSRTRAPVACSA
ncbi:hypothetical protein TNCV_541151 [Trichonephila clavipes]|nr:hypothetical protein TNCV_541151 [Trichonephila clavipes]